MTDRHSIGERPRLVRGFSFRDRLDRFDLVAGVLLGAAYVVAIVAFRGHFAFTDEADHHAQVTLFLLGRWQAWPTLTTIPGYHALTALLLSIFDGCSLDAMRLASAAYGLFAIAGFHALRARLWPGTQTIATAQFALLPILAPLFFLGYTDVLALALVLWACWAGVANRPLLSASLMLLLVGVRQHEIVWLPLVAGLAASAIERDATPRTLARSLLPYGVPVACFIGFWAWNGSISLSSTESGLHPDWVLHAGNLLLAPVVAIALLPFHAASMLGDAIRGMRARPGWLAVPILLIAAFWFGFSADNPYNRVQPGYYLHNGIADALGRATTARALAALGFALSLCTLARTPLRPRRVAWVWWPAATLFLMGSWLVELRYVAVPVALWLALRAPRGDRVEYATLALWAVVVVFLIAAILNRHVFP